MVNTKLREFVPRISMDRGARYVTQSRMWDNPTVAKPRRLKTADAKPKVKRVVVPRQPSLTAKMLKDLLA